VKRTTFLFLLMAPALTVVLAITAIYVGSEIQPYAESISEMGRKSTNLSLRISELSNKIEDEQEPLSKEDQKFLFQYSQQVQSATGKLFLQFSESIETVSSEHRRLGVYFLGIGLLNIFLVFAAYRELKPQAKESIESAL